MKKFLAGFSLVLLSTTAGAAELPGYGDVVEALMHGRSVALTMDLAQCVDNLGAKGPDRRAGLAIGSFMLPGSYLAFSDTHFTLSPIGSPATEFMRYRLNNDGSLTLDVTVLGMPDYHPVRQMNYRCTIGAGARFWTADSPAKR
ncbi:VirK family protein [Pseudoduganella sp. R-34]|uniref:VirK family protein n=1 Tax=Pseudoduganella sp. R-34 TaxID=3404062 RepID=UPI003CEAA78B